MDNILSHYLKTLKEISKSLLGSDSFQDAAAPEKNLVRHFFTGLSELGDASEIISIKQLNELLRFKHYRPYARLIRRKKLSVQQKAAIRAGAANGGASRSRKKQAASRANGLKGGRPIPDWRTCSTAAQYLKALCEGNRTTWETVANYNAKPSHLRRLKHLMSLADISNRDLRLPSEWDPSPRSLDPHKRSVVARRKKQRLSIPCSPRQAPYTFFDFIPQLLASPVVKMPAELDGFAVTEAARLAKALGIEMMDLPELTGISTAPFAKKRRGFTSDEFETLVRLNHIFQLAADAFAGDSLVARKWMKTAADELQGKTPLQLATSKADADTVESYLRKVNLEQYDMTQLLRSSQIPDQQKDAYKGS